MTHGNLTKIAVASTAVMATLASPAIAMADETTTTDDQTKQAIAQAQDSVAAGPAEHQWKPTRPSHRHPRPA